MLTRSAILAFALATPALASEPAMDAAQLAHALDRLSGTARVLYVAAHPDDENTRLLAWLANHRHATAAYLSLTRGGGGQNLVGDEQDELLDVIRTEELLAARRIDGALQRFTRLRDFGYSKSADETFATWGREEALADVVRVIRAFQPDVIVTRFDENPPNHGHHTASAILAREAFAAAADPARFPEQLREGLLPWQATRLVHNLTTFRQVVIPPDALAVDVGAYDPRLGLSYGELAALSRSRHVSQGFGVAGERGPLVERFVHLAGARAERDLLDGVDARWARLGSAGAPLDDALAAARAALSRDAPEAALPALVRAHRAFDALPDGPRVGDGRRELGRLIAAVTGLFVRATSPAPAITPGAEAKVDVEIVQRRPAELRLVRVGATGLAPKEIGEPLALLEKRVVSLAVPVPADARVSAPYWLEERSLPGRQVVKDPSLVGAPSSPPALVAELAIGVEDRVVTLAVPVVHAWTDPARGERERPFLVVPPATLTPAREAFLLPNGRATTVVLRVRAGRDGVAGEVALPVPAGWTCSPSRQPLALAKAGDQADVRFEVKAPSASAPPADIVPSVTVDGRAWSWREATIDHDHVPLQVVLQPAALRLVPLEIRVPAGRVGYVSGSGDTVAEDLAHVGLDVEILDEETLRGGDLSRFAAIVVGIRAYNTREDLRAAQPRLMDFVASGGTLVVQYQTNNRLAPLTVPIGPYPFEVGRDRITDETAALTPVRADHPALLAPNRIGPADFEGWVQERGIYFASKWDERYEPLFSARDPGEEPLLGSTLVARHGKGRYVYTGLVFFRELPAGVPGAYRLLSNLIARD